MIVKDLEEIKENLQNEIYKNLSDSKEEHEYKIKAITFAIYSIKQAIKGENIEFKLKYTKGEN